MGRGGQSLPLDNQTTNPEEHISKTSTADRPESMLRRVLLGGKLVTVGSRLKAVLAIDI